jgi:hypothetical protein
MAVQIAEVDPDVFRRREGALPPEGEVSRGFGTEQAR